MNKTERLRQLAKDYGLTGEHFFKDKRGFVIINRSGIERIQAKDNIKVVYETEKLEKDWIVLKAIATANDVSVESFGEASPENCMSKFYVAMAEKRACARAVLKLTQFYELDLYSDSEIEDKQPIKAVRSKKIDPVQFPESTIDKYHNDDIIYDNR